MGRNIHFAIRFSNGEILSMERWTNIFPDIVLNKKFFQEDLKYIDECNLSWFEMKKDWEENKETGKFIHHMTTVYAPYPSEMNSVNMFYKQKNNELQPLHKL